MKTCLTPTGRAGPRNAEPNMVLSSLKRTAQDLKMPDLHLAYSILCNLDLLPRYICCEPK